MQAMSGKHTERVSHGAMQLSRARCPPALSQCMFVPVCCPLPCVSATSQRTRLQRPARKLSRENAEPKPLNHSSPNPEERAPPEGKTRDLRLFQSLNFPCLHIAFQKRTPFCSTCTLLSPKPRNRQHRIQGVQLQRSKPKCKQAPVADVEGAQRAGNGRMVISCQRMNGHTAWRESWVSVFSDRLMVTAYVVSFC